MEIPTHSRESDRIEEELRQLILTLQLEPGQAVSEAMLMKRYGWGRTPLREAFQRLAEQSLLQIMPRQGVMITPLSVFDFVEVMDAMAVVIGPAASLACKHLSGAQIDQLEEIVRQAETSEEAGDFVQVARLDYEFHCILAEATGNRYLRRYLLHLHQAATRFNLAGWQRDGNARQSTLEHERIVQSLRDGNLAAIRSVMLNHIESARQRVMGTIQTEL
ncbi:MAG: GntR family transcriptional regulator [Anaerolineales bacterium]|nr:GntR family transcriptional regulator [Anaerolineales bacterium]